jgi:hypothetical protein
MIRDYVNGFVKPLDKINSMQLCSFGMSSQNTFKTT